MEYLVCGVPALLSDRAGATEVFKKYGLEDLIFSIDDSVSFDSALKAAESQGFVINPEISWSIFEDLSWKKVIARYNAVAQEVLDKLN